MHEVGHFLTYNFFFTVVRLKLLKPYITVCEMRFHTHIICFKIKNPPTLHSTSKLQPTTSPSFVFSAFASVRKKWGYEKKTIDSHLGRNSACFFVFILLYHSKVMIW
jgi:hypothetical protein